MLMRCLAPESWGWLVRTSRASVWLSCVWSAFIHRMAFNTACFLPSKDYLGGQIMALHSFFWHAY